MPNGDGQTPGEAIANAKLLEATIPTGLWQELKAEGLMRQDAPTEPKLRSLPRPIAPDSFTPSTIS